MNENRDQPYRTSVSNYVILFGPNEGTLIPLAMHPIQLRGLVACLIPRTLGTVLKFRPTPLPSTYTRFLRHALCLNVQI